jgi:hypothetical protein
MLELCNDDHTKQPRRAHGSRRQFFEIVWSKLVGYKAAENSDENKMVKAKAYKRSRSSDLIDTSEHTPKHSNTENSCRRSDELFSEEHWNLLIGDSELVTAKDRHLVEDTLLIAFSQVKRCCFESSDRILRKTKAQEDLSVGMCCKHCIGRSGQTKYGRYFPSSLRMLSQVDSCQKLVRHIATECLFCPPFVRIAVQKAIEFEQSHQRKYGSRVLFFRRIWRLLHKQSAIETLTPEMVQSKRKHNKINDHHKNNSALWQRIIGNSLLVSSADLNLVQDSELAVIAQMMACKLMPEERVGSFKDISIGWGGLVCIHCGGHQNDGKYFWKTNRTFAQSTSYQSLLSHVTISCPSVPGDIKATIQKFQETEFTDSGMSKSARASDSRKGFYNRIWKVLQNQDATLSTAPFVASKAGDHSGKYYQPQFVETTSINPHQFAQIDCAKALFKPPIVLDNVTLPPTKKGCDWRQINVNISSKQPIHSAYNFAPPQNVAQQFRPLSKKPKGRNSQVDNEGPVSVQTQQSHLETSEFLVPEFSQTTNSILKEGPIKKKAHSPKKPAKRGQQLHQRPPSNTYISGSSTNKETKNMHIVVDGKLSNPKPTHQFSGPESQLSFTENDGWDRGRCVPVQVPVAQAQLNKSKQAQGIITGKDGNTHNHPGQRQKVDAHHAYQILDTIEPTAKSATKPKRRRGPSSQSNNADLSRIVQAEMSTQATRGYSNDLGISHHSGTSLLSGSYTGSYQAVAPKATTPTKKKKTIDV